jgi:hypothetical protein
MASGSFLVDRWPLCVEHKAAWWTTKEAQTATNLPGELQEDSKGD